MRVFLAIEIEQNDAIVEIIKKISALTINQRIVTRQNSHLTVKFFGEKNPDEVELINNTIMKEIDSIKPFTITLRGIGYFGDRRSPHVLWIGIDPSDELKKLYDMVALLFGSDREATPHLTISRIKYGKLHDMTLLMNIIEQYKDVKFNTVTVNEIVLKESILERHGAIYRTLYNYSF